MKRYIKSFTYVSSAVHIDKLISQFPTINESDFDEVLRLDPTFKEGSTSGGKYAVWLLNQFSKGNFDSRDYSNVKDALEMFVKRSKVFTYSDLGRYKTVDEFLDDSARVGEIPLSDSESQKELQRNIHNAGDGDKKLLAKDGKWELWQPLTYEGSISLAQYGGQKAKWCTAYSGSDSSWKGYSARGSIYIFINTKNPKQKYQSCPATKSWFYNFSDKELGLDKLLTFLDQHQPFAEALDLHIERASELYVKESKLCNRSVLKIGDTTLRDMWLSVESYRGESNVVLPEGVELEKDAFISNRKVERVVLPEGITRIPDYSFLDCPNLVSVEIPKTVRVIGREVFRKSGLSEIVLPEGLEEIQYEAFAFCPNLESVKIPKYVRAIGYSAFGWSGLVEVAISGVVSVIPNGCFVFCEQLKTVRLPDGIIELDMFAFQDCASLKNINLPSSLQRIGKACFYNCTSLLEMVIPDSVTELEENAFKGCKNLTVFIHTDEFDDILEKCGVKEIVHDF